MDCKRVVAETVGDSQQRIEVGFRQLARVGRAYLRFYLEPKLPAVFDCDDVRMPGLIDRLYPIAKPQQYMRGNSLGFEAEIRRIGAV